MSAILKTFATFVSPAFYRAQFASTVKSLNADFVSGSIMPLYKAIALVGFTGYVSAQRCVSFCGCGEGVGGTAWVACTTPC